MKKLILIASLIFLSSHVLLFSQESKEDIKFKETFIEYMNLTKTKETFISSITGIMEQNVNNPKISEEQKKFLNDFINKIKNITDKEVLEIFMQPYKSAFNSNELKEMIKFYSTPTGKKLSDKQGEIMEEVKTNSEKFAQKIAQELIAQYQPKETESPKEETKVEEKNNTPKVETKK